MLATRAVCVCAAIVPTTTADPHACCRTHPSPAHHERRGEACQHCSHAQLTPPDGFQLAAPAWSAVPCFATAAAVFDRGRPLALTGPIGRDAERPPPLPRRFAVLLI